MAWTTLRVDIETHARLLELRRASGRSLMDTVSDTAEALRRQRLADRVSAEQDQLAEDEKAWSDYLGERNPLR